MHSYQAAPTTEREMAKPIPRFAHINGEVSVKNLQTHKIKCMNMLAIQDIV